MGCFTMRNTTQNIGCKYECKNPADCQHRDQSTHADLPALAYAKKSGEGDICLCKGYYCNSIWFTGWEIFGIVIGAIAAAFLLCCLFATASGLLHWPSICKNFKSICFISLLVIVGIACIVGNAAAAAKGS